MSKLSSWLRRKVGIPEQRIKLPANYRDIALLRVSAAMDKAGVPPELRQSVLDYLKANL